MNRKQNYKSFRRSKGAGLLEVMVASIILGLGLLGVAALQMSALQGSTGSQHRARAIDLASSLADRIRANTDRDNDYRSGVTASCAAPAQMCAMSPDGSVAADACTQAQVVAFDLWEIRCRNGVKNSLPNGELVVTCTDSIAGDGDDCTSGSRFTISISWDSPTDDAVDSTVDMHFVPGG